MSEESLLSGKFMVEEREVVPDAPPEQARKAWTERLGSQIADSKVLVADNGPALVGFLAFLDHHDRPWIPPGVAYVVDLYVVPEARGSPAARDLFHAATELWRGGYSETWTNTHVQNRRMQVLLKRAGFEPLEGFEIEGLQDQVYYRMGNHALPSDARTAGR